MRKPYIGITGFMSSSEVTEVLGSMPKDCERLLMVGVLASQKTLSGEKNKWPNRYPAVDQIAGIFPEHPLALNLIHYHTKEASALYDDLTKLTEIAGERLHGFQLNVMWPPPNHLRQYKLEHPEMKLVLQITRFTMCALLEHPEWVANNILYTYPELIDYVLLDPSGGRGIPLRRAFIRPYLETISAINPDLGLVVAGGLGPESLNLVSDIASKFPNVSIDAEGRLRDQDDKLDLDLAKNYLIRALEMFVANKY